MGNFFATMCCKTSSKIEASVFFIVLAIFVFFLITLCCKFLVRRLDEFLFEGTPPLHRSFIADLPIFPYRRNPKSEIIECSICLGEFNDGDMVRALPNCAHLFHQQCIDTWLARCGSCPTCRAPVEPECLVYDAQPVRVVVEVPPSPSASTPSMMSSPSVYSSPLNMIVDSARTTNRAYFDEYDDVVDIRLA